MAKAKEGLWIFVKFRQTSTYMFILAALMFYYHKLALHEIVKPCLDLHLCIAFVKIKKKGILGR
jgi:hypothetical protein